MVYKCDKCDILFERNQDYANHVKKHMIEIDKKIFNSQYVNFDFTKIKKSNEINIMSLKKLILENGLIKNGKPNNLINRNFFVNKHLIIFQNVFYYTDFLSNHVKISERLYCILNNLIDNENCECGKKIIKFKNFISGYNQYCSQSCSNRYTNFKRDEKIYKLIGNKTSTTRILNGTYNVTDETRKKQSKSALDPIVKRKKELTNIKRYGLSNPGVLGAYSSKSAENFIRNYIKENNINENICYFKNGGINKKEYYQIILDNTNGGKKYVSYDLTIFKDKELTTLDKIIEYNGPWHYRYNDYINRPNEPATPYKNSKTIKDAYNFDILKNNHIFALGIDIFIYWEDTKTLVKYDGRL